MTIAFRSNRTIIHDDRDMVVRIDAQNGMVQISIDRSDRLEFDQELYITSPHTINQIILELQRARDVALAGRDSL